MPIIHDTVTAAGARLAIWHATEGEERLRSMVTPADAASCEGMRSSRRRVERLAWCALLREMLPGAGEVRYNAAGAPEAEGYDGHIGVSHTCGDEGVFAALICSEHPCAVDIELFSRDFSRVRGRYIGDGERALSEAREQWFSAAAWCAKETIYKLYAASGVDFARDIRITGADPARGSIGASFMGRQTPDLGFSALDGLCVVWGFSIANYGRSSF
jgi:phosphopantetheinyl transferase